MIRARVPIALMLVACASCASAPPVAAPERGTEERLAEPPPPPPAPTCQAFAAPGVLRRAALVRAVDGGLGRWLQGVDVAPERRDGRFQGWMVRRLHPDDPCFAEVDLRPGDVVTRVNGRSLERPEQANEVFGSLRTARSLVVELVRNGQPRTLSLSVSDQ